MPDDLLTTAQAAADLGISPRRLRAISKAGGPSPVRLGHILFWRADDLAALRPRIRGRAGAPLGNYNWRGKVGRNCADQPLTP
jgi:hypothetical protein